MYVLGIDGGGTKTTGVIANTNGKVFGKATVGATNPNSVQAVEVKKELSRLNNMLRKQTGEIYPEVKRVFAGMSGVGHPTAKKEMYDMIRSSMQIGDNVTVDNDAITALYSGTLGEPGIVQISGTGSITFGINQYGERDRVGGWGHLIGEQGSGFALGRDGLQAAFLAHDGVAAATEIHDLLLTQFQIDALPDSIHYVYQSKNTKEMIASLSRFVVQAADNGDHVARKIIQKNGMNIGESIARLIQKLFKVEEQTDAIPVVLAGGLFNRFDLFQASIEEMLDSNNIDARLIIPKVEPVGGAIVAALREGNVEIDVEFPVTFSR